MAMNRLKLEDVISQAKEVLEGGNSDYVIALCRYIFRYYPRALEATRVLGEAYTEKKLLDEADQLFTYVLAADPHDVLGYVDRGFIAYERGSVDEAIMYYERAIELDPNIEQLRTELLRLYKERYGSSRTKLRLTKAGLANHRMRDGFYNQAIEEYNNILSETPDRLDIQTWLMEAYWCNRDYARAEKLAHELLEIYPYLIKANLILWHIYGVRRHQDKAGEYLEKAHALDPLNLIAERLFENAQASDETMKYVSMTGIATIPAFDPSNIEQETQEQPLLPVWVTADSETDRRLGLRGEDPSAAISEDAPTQESDWLSKLLAETEQAVEVQQQQVAESDAQSDLAQFRQSQNTDDAFDFFDEIEENQLQIDLDAGKATKKPGADSSLDLELESARSADANTGELEPFKTDDATLDSLFEELEPASPGADLHPANFDNQPATQSESFTAGGFDLELEPFDLSNSPTFAPQRFQFDADEPTPFGLEGDTKEDRLQGFDLGFDEEPTPFDLEVEARPERKPAFDFGFDEEPAPFSFEPSAPQPKGEVDFGAVSLPPFEDFTSPSPNPEMSSETAAELFEFGRTEKNAIRPDKLSFGDDKTPPPPFRLDDLNLNDSKAEPKLEPIPMLHDDEISKEDVPAPPFSLDDFNLDDLGANFEPAAASETEAKTELEPQVPVSTYNFDSSKPGPGLTGELSDFFDDAEPFGVDLFAPTLPPDQMEARFTQDDQETQPAPASEPETNFSGLTSETLPGLEALEAEPDFAAGGAEPLPSLDQLEAEAESAQAHDNLGPLPSFSFNEEDKAGFDFAPLPPFKLDDEPTTADDSNPLASFNLDEPKAADDFNPLSSFDLDDEPKAAEEVAPLSFFSLEDEKPATDESVPLPPFLLENEQETASDFSALPAFSWDEPDQKAQADDLAPLPSFALENEAQAVEELTPLPPFLMEDEPEAATDFSPLAAFSFDEPDQKAQADDLAPLPAFSLEDEPQAIDDLAPLPTFNLEDGKEALADIAPLPSFLMEAEDQTGEDLAPLPQFTLDAEDQTGEDLAPLPQFTLEDEDMARPIEPLPSFLMDAEEGTAQELAPLPSFLMEEDTAAVEANPLSFSSSEENANPNEAALEEQDANSYMNYLSALDEANTGPEPEAFEGAIAAPAGKPGAENRSEVEVAPRLEPHAFHRRDERGPLPEALARASATLVDSGEPIQAITNFEANSDQLSALSAEPIKASLTHEIEPTSVPGIERSDKENEDMPIKRGGNEDDSNVFDWEREELPDYLRDFALDEDEVARPGRPVNPPVGSSDMTTGPTRIRPRDPEPASPNELPDWFNSGTNRQPPQINLPGSNPVDLGGGTRSGGPGGPLPGWLDATDESKPNLGSRSSGNMPGMDDLGLDDLQPFSLDGGDGFGGPSLQPPSLSNNRSQTPPPSRPSAPPPAPFSLNDDLGNDIQPFSFDNMDTGFGNPAPPSAPPQRQAPPPPPAPRNQPPSFPPPAAPFNLTDDLGGDMQPFNFETMDGGAFASPPPPPTQRQAPPPPPQRQAPPPPAPRNQPPSFQPPVAPFNLSDDLGMDIQPFNFETMDGGAFASPTPPPPAQRPTPPQPQPRQATPPPAPISPFNLNDDLGDIPTFNPLDFGETPTQSPPPPPAPRVQPQSFQPPAPPPSFGGSNFDDLGLGDLQPFSIDEGGSAPPPPQRQSAPPPQRQAPPPQAAPFNPFDLGDDMPAPFNPFEGMEGQAGGSGPFNPPGFNPPPMGGEGFVQAGPGSLFGGNQPPATQRPSSPSGGRPNQPGGSGGLFPSDLDDVDLEPFSAGMDSIPGLNEPASFRPDLDSMPSGPRYSQPRPKSRDQEPEVEVEPGHERPLQNFGWIKDRARRNRDEEEESRGGAPDSLFKKLAEKRKQQEPKSPDFAPVLPEDLGPLEMDQFADYLPLEELERQAEQGATIPPPLPSFQPIEQPIDPGVQPFSFDFASSPAATPPKAEEPVEQPFSFEFDDTPATFAENPAVQPFNFDLGQESAPAQPDPQPFNFDLGQEPAIAQPDPQPFNFDLGEEAALPVPDPQPFNFDLGDDVKFELPPEDLPQAQEPHPEPAFNFDFGGAEAAQPVEQHLPETDFNFELEPELTEAPQAFKLDSFQLPAEPEPFDLGELKGNGAVQSLPDFDFSEMDTTPPPPPPPPIGNLFDNEELDFGLPSQGQPQIEPFNFDLGELSAVPPPPPPPRPMETLPEQPFSNRSVPPPPPRFAEAASPTADFAQSAPPPPPPAFKAEEPKVQPQAEPQPVISSNGSGNDQATYLNRLRQNPKDLEANMQLGNAYLDENKFGEAITHFNSAVKVADPETLKTIVAKLEKVTAASGANPRFHRVLGDAYMKQGQYHWALSEYSKALGPAAAKR